MRPSDDAVRALAEEILRRPEFAYWRSLESNLLITIAHWLQSYLDWSVRLHLQSPLLYWLFLVGLLLLALALLGHVVWSLRTAFQHSTTRGIQRTKSQRPPDWIEEAEGFARQGRFLEAAHRLLLGSIDLLLGRELIDLGRADANSVLREQVSRSELPAPLRNRFLDLLDAFERRWFRDRTEDGDLYRGWRELHAQLAAGARDRA